VAEFPTGVADRLGDISGGGSSFEFVDRGQNTHGVSLAVGGFWGILWGVKFLTRNYLVTLALVPAAAFAFASCGGSSEPAGDQAAAAELYIKLYSPTNLDCVRSEHKKVDNETATYLLEAYQAYEAYEYDKEDAAYAAIGEETVTELTAALNKCALG
jgi:hypothetical protein